MAIMPEEFESQHKSALPPPPESGPDLEIVNNEEALSEASFAVDSLFTHLDFDRPHEYSPEDLRLLFSQQEIDRFDSSFYLFVSVDDEGKETTIERDTDEIAVAMIHNPLPTSSSDSDAYNQRLKALKNNVASYDDELEDLIASDRIMQSLKANRLMGRSSAGTDQEITAAMRVRRSILAHRYGVDHE